MLYLKLLGHYYIDGLFDDSETPIVTDITLGHKGTIRLHSNKQDSLYVMHEDLSNVPKYIKDEFKNCKYTSGALIYEALSKGVVKLPRAAKMVVVPRGEVCSLSPYYLIYWPIEVDELEELRKMDGKLGTWYRDFEIPTTLPDNWAQDPTLTAIDASIFNSGVYIGNPGASSLITDSNWTFKFDNEKEQGKEKENMNNLFGNLRVGKAGSNYSITYFGTVAYKGKTWYNNTVYDC